MTQVDRPSRYNNLLGGLDNAVRQAETRHLHDMLIVDADCHAKETFDLFMKYVDEDYRKSILRANEGVEGGYRYLGSQSIRQTFTDFVDGVRITRPESSYPEPMGPEEIVSIFTRRLQDIGIKYVLLFPDAMLNLNMDSRNPRLEVEIAKAYLHFMLDNFLGKYPEIIGTIYAPTTALDRAAELVDDMGSEKGVSGVLVPSETPTLPGGPDWNPLWETAQRKDLPICVHGLSGSLPEWFFGEQDSEKPVSLARMMLGFPFSLSRFITSLLVGGVPERFPKLKFVFIEGGVAYIPFLMQRWDSIYLRAKDEAPLLTKLPSEYMKDFYWTQQPLEFLQMNALKATFEMFDAENKLLYASDYPHWDFDTPSVIYDLPFLTETAKKKVLGENAAKLFKIRL